MSKGVVVVTNMPVPYRAPVFDYIEVKKICFHAIYCTQRESNRDWQVDVSKHQHSYLSENSKQKSDGYNYVHLNWDIWSALNGVRPSTVITTGYYPTQLIAFLWAKLHGAKHIVMTDGWLGSEAHLGLVHRLVRKFVYRFTHAFVGASNGSLALFSSYGVSADKQFKSLLPVVAQSKVSLTPIESREVDILFVGRLEEPKNARLFLQICNEANVLLGRSLSVKVVGQGSLATELAEYATIHNVKVEFTSFVPPEQIHEVYKAAKLLLLPTKVEAWGLVIAEAMSQSVVPIISDKTAAAGELVINGENGLVLPVFDVTVWASNVAKLLNNQMKLKSFSLKAKKSAAQYTVDAAAIGLLEAIIYANK